ncbi:translation initiation factor IF-2-like [Ictidomys tridecemlineatus]|uniref:translation initiation factor IF-2-like n=1 Tax=Ictidomys tridecemlineatus TaxID=43179 RepID=UPI00038BFF98|nr:translation initiation factor IF-2-like [Ictidomys tridecemlineatus]KAG3262238.1 translation initiation factor IF-2-like [Ictidomys tridecemlineatus]
MEWEHSEKVIQSQSPSASSPQEPLHKLRVAARSSRKTPSDPPGERRVGDPAFGSRVGGCCGRISSKSYLEGLGPTRAPCECLANFPYTLLAGPPGGFAWERPARGSPPASVTGKPWEPPRRSAFPGNPLSRLVAGRQELRIHTTDTPPRGRVGDPGKKQNGQGKESPELEGDWKTPPPPPILRPRKGPPRAHGGARPWPPSRPPSPCAAAPLRSPGRQARLLEPLLWQPASCGGFMNIPGRGSPRAAGGRSGGGGR